MSAEEDLLYGLLATRRDRLAELVGGTGGTGGNPQERLVELLRRVDSALDAGEAGLRLARPLCAVCGEIVTVGELDGERAIRVCLDCLTPEERRGLEKDLEKAAEVQRALLPPRRFAQDGWEVAWLWEPLGVVSGDHIDLLPPRGPGEATHLIFGDVAGKGVAASLLQSLLYALFRGLAEAPVTELLAQANRRFCAATTTASYATLIALCLHPEGRLELANAGHLRPLYADRRGVRPIEGSGFPLGLFCEAAYTGHEVQVGTGDSVLLYSDGWTEAAVGDEEFGIGRAAAALRRHAELPLPQLLTACRQDMESFLAGAPRVDDLSLVVLRRTG